MKRWTSVVVVGLLAWASQALAYDGPNPVSYDRTVNDIRVVLTTQGKVLPDGLTNFVMTAYVPITADNVGKMVLLQILKKTGTSVASDTLIVACDYEPEPTDVGTTVAFPCDMFELIPWSPAEGTSVQVYPYVTRQGAITTNHNGRANALTLQVVGDDTKEPNDFFSDANNLGTVTTPLSFIDLVSLDGDWYKFTAPAGTGSAEIVIEYFDLAAYLDLYVFDADGNLVAYGDGIGDGQRANAVVTPGLTYYIYIDNSYYQPGFYDLSVSVGPPDLVEITAGPSGTPNPVDSGADVAMGVEATDSLGHPLSYLWQSACPGMTTGRFNSRIAQYPTWTAPINAAEFPRPCTITVTVTDSRGISTSGSYTQMVDVAPHTLTIVTPATGTPDPVASKGNVYLTVFANDSYDHALSYAWQATCPTLPTAGSFWPDNTVREPVWTAPTNLTGSEQICTLLVTITDNIDQTVQSTWIQHITLPPHTLTITTPAAGTPNPVASSQLVDLSVTATDTHNHLLTYAWTATCPGLPNNGTFEPSNTAEAPDWIAPENTTGSSQICTIQVVVNDGNGLTQSSSYDQVVNVLVHTLTIVNGPVGVPNPVASGGTVALDLYAEDTFGHLLTYQWTATCPALSGGGTFAPSNTERKPTWTAPVNATGSMQTCTLGVTVSDGQGLTSSKSYSQQVESVADAVNITVPAAGTPNPVASEGTVAVSVTAQDTIGHTLSYVWQALCPGLPTMGTFAPNNTVPNPTWTAPKNLTGFQQTCSISVNVSDGVGQSNSSSYQQTVNAAPHTLTITTPANGTPEPVASGGNVALTVVATDSYQHDVSYAWTASCPGLPTNGTFSPNAFVQSPTWTAPKNITGSQQACTFDVTASDGLGKNAVSSHTHHVNVLPDTVTITDGPNGSPDPVASQGAVTLAVTATDSYEHAIGYVWTASCPGLPTNGSFTPSNTAQNPTWTAPRNITGSQQACTVSVVASDSFSHSANGSYTQRVDAAPHTLTVTTPATGTPDPVASQGLVTLSVAAVDSYDHLLSYTWTASCPGLPTTGTFAPSNTTQNPTWTAPRNITGSQQTCTLQAAISDGVDKNLTSTHTQRVDPAPHTLTLTTPATGTPDPVASLGTVTLNVAAVDSYDHPVSYVWTASCPGLPTTGTFAPSNTVQTPTWTAPKNITGSQQTCTLQAAISDGVDKNLTSTHTQRVDVLPDTVTITAGPTTSVDPVASGGTTTLGVSATDAYDHPLTYTWTATCPGLPDAGTFAPSNTVQNPTWTAPANRTGSQQTCTLGVTASDGLGHSASASRSQRVNSVPDSVTITAPAAGTPNPVASQGNVTLSVAAEDAIIGHVISYAWTATCPGLATTGSFTPSNTVQNPTWTAPKNFTGSQQACTLAVTASDGHGQSASSSVLLGVDAAPHTLTVTTPATGSPDPVASQGLVTLSVAAVDSYDHLLSYTWTASCPGLPTTGTFAPSNMAQNPTWTAPKNITGSQQTCTLQVAISDGVDKNVTSTHTQRVDPTPHTLTVTTPATGTPDPVVSLGTVTLNVAAVDSYDHPLSYVWTASCPGLPTTGTFAPSNTVQTPTWTAPRNITGSQQTCTLQAAISDGVDKNLTSTHTQRVDVLPDTVTITAGPTTSVDPVASGGTTTLGVTATDAYDHPLTYTWTATCPGLPTTGTFAPSNTAQNPTWTAPANRTGSQQTCTLGVTASDGLGHSASASRPQRVNSVPDSVTIATPAAGTPNPVASQGNVTLSVAAEDAIIGHVISYAWTATCPGLPTTGSFTPSNTVQNPTWTAPRNITGSQQACTLAVTASDGHGQSASSSVPLGVETAAHTLTVTTPATGSPDPVASQGLVTLSVAAVDSYDHPIGYTWTASCPGLPTTGTFAPSNTAQNPTWTAPRNITGSQQTCTLQVAISDGVDKNVTSAHTQRVDSVPHTVTITSGPSGLPNPVLSSGTVSMSVVAVDSFDHALTYAWTAVCPTLDGNGTFNNASSATPTWTAPANLTRAPQACTLQVTVGDGQGLTKTATTTQTVTSLANDITIQSGPIGSPDPVASAGEVDLTVTATASLGGLTYAWSANCPDLAGNGTFDDATLREPKWAAPANQSGAEKTCTISVSVGDGVETPQVASYQQRVSSGIFTYYFAEGATINGFFETRIALLNPDPALAASVSVDFQLKDTTMVLTHTLTIAAGQRVTLDVAKLKDVNPALAPLVSAEFSTVIRSDMPLVADRTMTWDSRGYGSHAETSIAAPAATWYLAEGATIGDFELYYLVQNPNSVDVTYEVTYLLPPPAAPIVRTYTVGANTRTNIAVHAEPGLENAEVSAIIRAPDTTPIIVERAMYLSSAGLFYGAGHESAGITAPAAQWFFAEGATGAFFDLFILVANPNDTGTAVTATFLFDDGTTCSKAVGNAWEGGELVVGPKSRYNIWVDTESIPGCPRSLADAAISTTVTSTLPVIAERTMWWPGPTAGSWAETHNAPGATKTGTLWGLADGEQGGARGTETYLLVANTSPYPGLAEVRLYFEDGVSLSRQITLPPNSRTNVPVGASEDAGGFGTAVVNKRFGAVVESLAVEGQPGAAQIVVERAMYSNGPGAAFWAAGTDVLATRLR